MDDDDSSTPLTTTPPRLPGPLHSSSSSKLRRRNSLSTSVILPSNLSHLSSTKPRHSCSFPTQNGTSPATPRHRPPQLDLELLSLKTSDSYTSLKDLLPSSSFAAVQSPTPNTSSGYEISIRNRLVKQAAWAYLQPMSSTCGPSGPHFLQRLWLKLSSFLSRTLRRLLPCFTLS